MKFLIDENLPASLAEVFHKYGFEIEFVSKNKELRSQTDEVLFQYARKHQMIVVTKDVGFVLSPLSSGLKGLVIIRCDHRLGSEGICREVNAALESLTKEDYAGVIIIETGVIRLRRF